MAAPLTTKEVPATARHRVNSETVEEPANPDKGDKSHQLQDYCPGSLRAGAYGVWGHPCDRVTAVAKLGAAGNHASRQEELKGIDAPAATRGEGCPRCSIGRSEMSCSPRPNPWLPRPVWVHSSARCCARCCSADRWSPSSLSVARTPRMAQRRPPA